MSKVTTTVVVSHLCVVVLKVVLAVVASVCFVLLVMCDSMYACYETLVLAFVYYHQPALQASHWRPAPAILSPRSPHFLTVICVP